MNQSYLINLNRTIKDALFRLEKNKQKCLIVVDKNQKFYGTLTDGDVRRAILNNSNVHNTIKSYVKKKPVVIREVDYKKLSSNDIDKLFKKFKNSKIDLIPVINEKKRVIHLIDSEAKKNSA